jgi:F-box domain
MSSFCDLHHELALCLAYVDFRDVCTLSATCRSLRASCLAFLAERKSLDVSPLGIRSPGALRVAAKRCPLLEELIAEDVRCLSDADLVPVLLATPKLRILRLRDLRHVSNAVLHAFIRPQPPPLEELSLDGCRQISDEVLEQLSTTSVTHTLKVLNLASTCITDTTVALMHRFRALESIDLSYTYEPDGVGYGGGGTHWHITRSRGVTCAGLQRWFSACITEGVSLPLKSLRLSHRKLQHADWLGQLTALRAKVEALDVSHTGLSADVLMLGVARLYKVSPCLHTLRMAALLPGDHGVVQEFALACTGIRVLDLSNHNVLSDADLAALSQTQVEDLTLVRCARITPRGLAELLTTTPNLRRLVCVRCVGDRHMRVLAKQHRHILISWG